MYNLRFQFWVNASIFVLFRNCVYKLNSLQNTGTLVSSFGASSHCHMIASLTGKPLSLLTATFPTLFCFNLYRERRNYFGHIAGTIWVSPLKASTAARGLKLSDGKVTSVLRNANMSVILMQDVSALRP